MNWTDSLALVISLAIVAAAVLMAWDASKTPSIKDDNE